MAILAAEPFAAEYSITTGSGAITLAGRIGNYRRLSEAGVADTNVVFLEIRLVSGGVTTEYEMGFYTYAAAGPTLTIVGSPLRSSNANSKVSWSSGTKTVVMSQPPYLYPRDDRLVVVDPADYTKRARLDAGGVTAGQTRVLTMIDQDLTLGTAAALNWTTGTYTPTVTSVGGTITTISGASGWYRRIGDLAVYGGSFTVTNNGTGSTGANVTLPFTNSNNFQTMGMMRSGTGNSAAMGAVPPSGGTMTFYKVDGTYPFVTGNAYGFEGWMVVQ